MSENSARDRSGDADAATPFDNVDVDRHLDRDGPAPDGEGRTTEEAAQIRKQIAQIAAGNRTRPTREQISLEPTDVN